MRYTYHVFTPFTRKENLGALLDNLTPLGVRWHLVISDPSLLGVHPIWEEWVDIDFCPLQTPPGWFGGYYAMNWFLNHVEWNDHDRYIQLNDDDLYEPGFFERMDAVAGELLICTMKRGDASPPKADTPAQPFHTLTACRENLNCGGVGGEQIMMSGRAYRNFRFGKGFSGDWDMIADVLANYQPNFVPEACVCFNALEPGRWKK